MENVRHNPQRSRFELDIEGETAVADYRLQGDEMHFTHTWVPEAGRGKGAAAALVKAGLEYARENQLRPVPLCSYVVTYLQKHPEYLS